MSLRRISPCALRLMMAISLCASHPAFAAGPRKPLTGYTITSWSKKDGLAPGMVYAVAQDHEGYLWVGTDNGLFRFDGLRFISWDSLSSTPLPKAAVRILFVSREGDIWASLDGGSLAHIHNGQLQVFTKADGITVGSITTIMESPDGTLWVGGRGGLFTKTSDGWAKVNYPDGAVSAGYVDQTHLVISSGLGLFRWDPKQKRFEQIAKTETAPQAIALDETGRAYVTDLVRGFRIVGHEDASDPLIRGRGIRLLPDRSGNLWVGTLGQGLWLVPAKDRTDSDAIEQTSSLTGLLSDDGVLSLTEDRDGNIWVGLTEGLVRLIRQSIEQITDAGLVTNLVAHRDGDVWLGTTDELIRFRQGKNGQVRDSISLNGARIQSMHYDEHGKLLVATDRSIAEVRNGTLSYLPGVERLDQIDWIASDGREGLWLYDRKAGLARWSDGQLSDSKLPPELARARVTAFFTDSARRLWTALADGRVAVVEKNLDVHFFGEADGLSGGAYSAIYEDAKGVMWLGGLKGLSRSIDGHFVTVSTKNGFPGQVTGIVEDLAGSLWTGTSMGIIHFRREEFDAAVNPTAPHMFQYVQYDRGDGLAGLPLAMYSNSQRAIRSADGRLWFIGARGVSLIDPPSMTQPPSPRPARIDRIIANSVVVPATRGVVLPPKTSKLTIEYTTLNLRSMSKTRFRYRLDGFDNDWIEAGTRQEASYTNLPPRAYRFRVYAIEDQNAGNPTETVLDFSIQPMFYQTRLFFSVVGSLLIGIVWTTWALHVRRIRNTFALLTGERTRLSREIHDTLLQGLVGMALQCDAMANDPEWLAPERRGQCLRLRKRIDAYVREARSAIFDLRSTAQRSRDLGTALTTAAEQITAGTSVKVVSEITGTPLRYPPVVEQQLLRIGREAMTNVVRHAHASELKMALDYRPTAVALRITDDGRGFDPASVDRDGAEHYGLTGIRERTENLHGSVRITTRPGDGTSLEVTVPIRAEEPSSKSAWPQWKTVGALFGARHQKGVTVSVLQDR